MLLTQKEWNNITKNEKHNTTKTETLKQMNHSSLWTNFAQFHVNNNKQKQRTNKNHRFQKPQNIKNILIQDTTKNTLLIL